MVDAFASDRSDQSFGEAVLPRRAWSDRFVADAHGSQSMPDGNALDLIPIADQVARGLIPRECLCDLARDPVRGRMRCDVDPDEISAGQSHDDEGIERVEAKGWGNEYDTTPGSRRLSSRVSEQPGRLDQQHQGRDQIEYGQLDLGKELNSRGAHEAHDQRADERALQAAEAADDDDDEGEYERVEAHPEHRRLARHDDRAAEARHEAADRKCRHVDQPDIDPERRGHAAIL